MNVFSTARGRIQWFFVLALAFSLVRPTSAQLALTNWLAAQSAFQKSGALLGQKKFEAARSDLIYAAPRLPAPYSAMATQFIERITALSKEEDATLRTEAAATLCADMQSYAAALKLKPVKKSKNDDDEDDGAAWWLFETGDVRGALAQYKRRLPREDVQVYQEYYKKQMELLPAHAANLASVPLALELVRERYLKTYEHKADFFGALRELHRVLPFAKEATNSVAVHQEIIRCLSGLNDDAGRDAWENKVLVDFKSDVDACAGVYIDRGLRAYHLWRDYDTALMWMRKACAQSPDLKLWGDAQYSVGLILQDQKQFDEAIAAFNEIFPSKVNDHLLEEGSSDDCKNYRFKSALRVSECYESKNDLPRALEFARLAKTRYQFISFCPFCQKRAREELDKRIAALEAKSSAAR
jgi:tetratricopeptide (TPR) repeat protein